MDIEWKYDSFGKKYREIGKGLIEYMPTVVVDGFEVYEDELEEFNNRRKAAKAALLLKEQEAFKNSPPLMHCPFEHGINNACKRDKCAIFADGKCSIAVVADNIGAAEAQNNGGKCPFSIYARCEKCALNNNGCAIVRLAAATMKGE